MSPSTAAAVAGTPRTDLPRPPSASAREVAAAYRACLRIAQAHYENFTVGSLLLPRAHRRHIAALYAFARAADDFADEGDVSREERLARLDAWEWALEEAYRGRPTEPIFVALADTAYRFTIPIAPFKRLLAAFRSDVDFRPFRTFDELRGYCRGSADPVGHLVLYLFGYRDERRQRLSDLVCTGLQLANFWQDVSVDARKGRVYVPLEDLERFGVTTDDLLAGNFRAEVRSLLRFEVERARSLLTEGAQLAEIVEPRLAREVRLFAGGGLAILRRIEGVDYDVLTRRPTLSKLDKLRLIAGGLRAPAPPAAPQRTSPRQPAASGALHPLDGPRLEQAYAFCRDVTRKSSSNFFRAFQLLAPVQRRALFAVYAFCRFVDDVADEATPRDPAALLALWRGELDAVYGGTPTRKVGVALADAVRRFGLERRHFEDILRGVEMDLTRKRYETWEEMQGYCYLVASAVGLLCIEIFGYTNPAARSYAVDLGLAFQLTNILRDVEEDAKRGRIYLPLEDLRRFGVGEDELLAGRYSPRVAALLAFESGRARAFYLRARGTLPPEDRRSLAAAEAMRAIYERLLDRIERRRFDVFGRRVALPGYEKLSLAVSGWARAQLSLLA
ncbi:MAG: squalene synthase HpnC [Thermodesulfobacteriota bacterium]